MHAGQIVASCGQPRRQVRKLSQASQFLSLSLVSQCTARPEACTGQRLTPPRKRLDFTWEQFYCQTRLQNDNIPYPRIRHICVLIFRWFFRDQMPRRRQRSSTRARPDRESFKGDGCHETRVQALTTSAAWLVLSQAQGACRGRMCQLL